jgi:hypothetical protein
VAAVTVLVQREDLLALAEHVGSRRCDSVIGMAAAARWEEGPGAWRQGKRERVRGEGARTLK